MSPFHGVVPIKIRKRHCFTLPGPNQTFDFTAGLCPGHSFLVTNRVGPASGRKYSRHHLLSSCQVRIIEGPVDGSTRIVTARRGFDSGVKMERSNPRCPPARATTLTKPANCAWPRTPLANGYFTQDEREETASIHMIQAMITLEFQLLLL
jgi:hypothetical protein